MFTISDMIDQAKELFGDSGVAQAAGALDLGQVLESAGVDADALAQMAPEDALPFLEQAGVDPELLSGIEADGAMQAFLNRAPAE